MAEISTEDAVEQLHQMFGDYDKTALAAVLEVRLSTLPARLFRYGLMPGEGNT